MAHEVDTEMGNVSNGLDPQVEAPEYVSPEVASSRSNPNISPNDDDWLRIHQMFTQMLKTPGKSVDRILKENFSRHDAVLFTPSENTQVKALQKLRTQRYGALLRGRFKGVDQSLASKLTMMYFGRPVAPTTTVLDESDAIGDSRAPVGPRFKVEPPLHFFTAHEHLSWGNDELRGKGDAVRSIPILTESEKAPFLNLRGGVADEDELSTIPDCSSEGDGRRLTPDSNWIPLYGFRGCVPFVPTDFSSLASAVEKLLTLAPLQRGRSRPFSLIHFDQSGTGRKLAIADRTPFSKTSPCALHIRNHFSDKDDHQNCCAFFVKLEGEPDPVHLEPQPEQLQTDVVKIGYPELDEEEDPEQKVMRYAYVTFPKAKGAGAFDIEDFAANQYNPCMQVAIDTLIGIPSEKFHNLIFSLYDKNEPEGKFSINRAAGSLGGSGMQTEVWNRLHPLNSPNARWMLKVSRIPADELALIIHNYYCPQFPTLTRLDIGNVPSTIRQLVKQVWSTDSIKKMRSVRLRAGSASLNRRISHPDVLEIDMNEKHDKDQLAELDKGLDDLISAPSNPWIMLCPVWETEESRIYPSWVGADAATVEFPPLGSSLSDFMASVQVLCRMNPDRKYNPERDSVFIKAVADHGPDPEIRPVLDAPAFLIDPETTNMAWYHIRSYITSCNIEVTIFSTMEMDWNYGIPRTNLWGIKPAPPPPDKRVPEGADTYTALQYENDPNLNRNNIQPLAPRVDLSGGSIRIWEDSTHQSDKTTRIALESPVSKHVAPDLLENSLANQNENETIQPFFMQPSVHDGPRPRIPLHAPPAEHFLRTTSQVPMVSQAVMTPTQQARAESTIWDLRGLLLSRLWKCAHTNCNFSCQLPDAETIHKHLENNHGPVSKCMWCDTRLFGEWSEEQRMDHLRAEHMDKLAEAIGRGEPRALGATFVRGKQTEADSSRQAATSSHSDPPRAIGNPPTNWYDCLGPKAYADPCLECHLPNCPRPKLRNLDSRQVFEHFLRYHPEAERMCPFCHLEFFTTEAQGASTEVKLRPEHEIIKHFECHVYQLWGPTGISNIRPEEPTSSRAPNGAPEIKKCPLFSTCGAVIEYMTEDQVAQHLRNSHKPALRIPPSPTPPRQDLSQQETRDPMTRARVPLAPLYESPTARNRRTPSDLPEDRSGHHSMDPSPSILVRSQLRKRKHRAVRDSDIEDPEGEASVSQTAKVLGESSRTRTSQQTRSKKQKPNPAQVQDREAEDEPGLSRGRTRTRPSDIQQGCRQRSPSLDWSFILDPVELDFVPSEDMYCSKCLRKAPKLNDQSPGRSLLGRRAEVEFHTAPDRCCRIRNGIGMAANLPNRSGWIHAKDLRGQKLGDIKDGFLKKYPGYAQTLYPTKPTDRNTSVWRSDPNNEDNKAWWDIPWPPFEGEPPFPGPWEYPGTPQVSTGKRRRDLKPARQPHDPAYRYRSDNDSDDGLEPDVDDTQQFTEAAETADIGENTGRSTRRKRKAAEIAEPSASVEVNDADAGTSSKRPKKPTGGPKKRRASAVQPAKTTRSARIANKEKGPAGPVDVEEDEEDALKPRTKAKATKRVKAEPKTPKPTRAKRPKSTAVPTRASTRSAVVRQRAEREARGA